MTNRTGRDKDNTFQRNGSSLRGSSLPTSGLLRVCRIGRAQGLKGEVNVQVFTDIPETRFAAGAVLADGSGKLYAVERSRTFKDRWIVKFADINDRNASKRLKGTVLFIKKSTSTKSGSTLLPLNGAAAGMPGVSSAPDAAPDALDVPSASGGSPAVADRFPLSNTGSDPADGDGGNNEIGTDAGSDNDGWYPDELIGCEVLQVNDHAEALAADYDGVDAHTAGKVAGVDLNGPQALIEAELNGDDAPEHKGKHVLIPFVEEIVPIVDPAEGYILIDPPEGLFDL